MRIIAPIMIALILSSCATGFTGGRFFEALGEEGEIVIVASGEGLSNLLPDPISRRARRLTLSFVPSDGDWIVSGAIEGRFPSFAVNSMLSKGNFVKEGGVYGNGEIEVFSPGNGLILFSTSSLSAFMDRALYNREILIGGSISDVLFSEGISVYSSDPVTLPGNTGINLSGKVDTVLLTVRGDNIRGIIKANSESSAVTVLRSVRNEAVKRIREEGLPLDTKQLSEYFYSDGDAVIINAPVSLFGGLYAAL